MATPRPLSFADSGRQSPFKRQNSASPSATVRASTPTSSPTKAAPAILPTKNGSLSPEKSSPFVRRPSQISNTGDRPSSPFARPGSSLGRPGSSLSIPQSPSRQVSNASNNSRPDDVTATPRPMPVLTRRMTPPSPQPVLRDREETPAVAPPSPRYESVSASPSPFDGPSLDSPFTHVANSPSISAAPAPAPSQAMLRPSTYRIPTSSTVTTIKQPLFTSTVPSFTPPTASRPQLHRGLSNKANNGSYNHVAPPLLRSMRESFEVIDSTNSGTITSTSVCEVLDQMGLPNSASNLKDFFTPNTPSNLNLARYLDTLSGPLSELSHPEELTAAFEAFDADDSGQIDIVELRRALVQTGGKEELSEREIDEILGEFATRRHFGGKGLSVAKSKGEVFRYRDFMGAIGGGVGDAAGSAEGVVV
ncbi:hypothetical protein LTR62_005348 [Meristemomyces frigidus]|uniref:EF-hand domain-containing protein n=1 Tax=Meristemomyces frigidus TaxID=1508187 RepID=A0AAN7TL68_9PEZI|nr:hypothetical protein LTR62_005348 [Meristemomyces frigidus]